MSPISQKRTQRFTIIAQDPSIMVKKRVSSIEHPEGAQRNHKNYEMRILTAEVEVPAEELAPGPRGSRVQIVDYNASTGELYTPLEYKVLEGGEYCDPFKDEPDQTLLTYPTFHAQNVYAIVMRTLARFELALGRRISWSFDGHQLMVAPHAFAEANAFYSTRNRALLFGYFPKPNPKPEKAAESQKGDAPQAANGWVFTCLSHDIVVHETTHALVDGLRKRYTDPSSPEQAGFHEGFADVIALLSIFSLPNVVERVIDRHKTKGGDSGLIPRKYLEIEALRDSVIFGLGKEFGAELFARSGVRTAALRKSVKIKPASETGKPQKEDEFAEPHRRGEILVAAMLNAFLHVWCERLKALGTLPDKRASRKQSRGESLDRTLPDKQAGCKQSQSECVDRQRVVEEGANAADHLLTMAIRALDYTPPTDLEFCDYLSALLTADHEIRPDDSKYKFRKTLLECFKAYGIRPTSKVGGAEEGIWEAPYSTLRYDRTRFESLNRDPDEVFRFIWENRKELGIEEDAYTRVLSVRPCVRINPDDGFVLRETVAEYYQQLSIEADELKKFGIKAPPRLLKQFNHRSITVYGGGALIFDEFGHVKFHIRNRILNPERQTRRLKYLWKYGFFDTPHENGTSDSYGERRFAQMHRERFKLFPGLSCKRKMNHENHFKAEQWNTDNWIAQDEEDDDIEFDDACQSASTKQDHGPVEAA